MNELCKTCRNLIKVRKNCYLCDITNEPMNSDDFVEACTEYESLDHVIEKCKWKHGKAEGLYITSCGSEWFEYGMFPIIDFKYCPKCGKLIEVVKDENCKM